jgi:hypothetical protein
MKFFMMATTGMEKHTRIGKFFFSLTGKKQVNTLSLLPEPTCPAELRTIWQLMLDFL